METKVIEINHNKLVIDIPKGMELDTENTDVTKGVIMLRKKKDITYEEIVKLGFCVNSEIGSLSGITVTSISIIFITDILQTSIWLMLILQRFQASSTLRIKKTHRQ